MNHEFNMDFICVHCGASQADVIAGSRGAYCMSKPGNAQGPPKPTPPPPVSMVRATSPCGHDAGLVYRVVNGDIEEWATCLACLLKWVASQGGPVEWRKK